MAEYRQQHHMMFDSVGEANFARMCHQLVVKVYDNVGYVPGPAKGKDGGVDAKYSAQHIGKPMLQFKWREVITYDDKKLRAATLKEFTEWIADKCGSGQTGKFVFITNVRRTQNDIRLTEDAIKLYPNADIEYWDYDRLSMLSDSYPDVTEELLAPFKSLEIKKKEQEVKQAREELARREKELLTLEPEFINVSRRFKTQFIDWEFIADTYYAFVYIVEPIYVDDNDGVRKIMRDLFQIDESTESRIQEILLKDGRLDITGNIITVNDSERAAKIARQMIDEVGADIEKVISLIQGN